MELEERWKKYPLTDIDKESIAAVLEQLKSKQNKVYIFGAGMYGMRLAYEMRARNLRIDGFWDNNNSLVGTAIRSG